MMYKIFLRFPDALRPSFPRIKDKLSEDDPSTSARVASGGRGWRAWC